MRTSAATCVRVLARRPVLVAEATLVLVLLLTACATLDGRSRAAPSSAGCVRTAIAEVAELERAGDKRAHCLGAARISQRCSIFEAALASYAKEIRDVFGRGDAELADIRAAHAGIRCARARTEAGDQVSCCEAQGY